MLEWPVSTHAAGSAARAKDGATASAIAVVATMSALRALELQVIRVIVERNTRMGEQDLLEPSEDGGMMAWRSQSQAASRTWRAPLSWHTFTASVAVSR